VHKARDSLVDAMMRAESRTFLAELGSKPCASVDLADRCKAPHLGCNVPHSERSASHPAMRAARIVKSRASNKLSSGAGREADNAQPLVLPKRCRLAVPVRDHRGKLRFRESAEILRQVNNLGRRMLLVRFDDGTTTFLFPHEVVFAVTEV